MAYSGTAFYLVLSSIKSKKLKQSHNTLMEEPGGEEVWILLIHDLGTRWG